MENGRTALVLVPGLLCDAQLYWPQVAALSDVANVTVADMTGSASLGEMAEAVLEATPGRFALAGLSMGGYVCFEVWRRAPERVAALALLDTSARPDTSEQTARRLRFVETARRVGLDPVLDELWPIVVAPSRHDDGALRRIFDSMAHHLGPDVFARQQDAIIERPDSRGDLALIAVPTLVVCGRDDAVTPLEVNQEMATGIAGAEIVVVDDCGHLATLERPEVVNAALRAWLVA